MGCLPLHRLQERAPRWAAISFLMWIPMIMPPSLRNLCALLLFRLSTELRSLPSLKTGLTNTSDSRNSNQISDAR